MTASLPSAVPGISAVPGTGGASDIANRYGEQLAAGHPSVAVDVGPLYIRDGNVHTSSGGASALPRISVPSCAPTVRRNSPRDSLKASGRSMLG